jgi:integrase
VPKSSSRVHGAHIEKAGARERLEARGEPHWKSLGERKALGFRKSPTGPGTWIARWTEPARQLERKRPAYRFKPLGDVQSVTYGEAVNAAMEFFPEAERAYRYRQLGTPIEDVKTIEEACRQYVANLQVEKDKEAAERAASKFASTIYARPFGQIKLADLDALHVEQWRNSLRTGTCGPNSVNRIFRQFKAAMNHIKSVHRGIQCDSDAWRSVKQLQAKPPAHNVYLTIEHRRLLLGICDRIKTPQELKADPELVECNAALGNLMRAMMYTGARPKELVTAKVADLDLRTGTLRLISSKNKTGEARPREFFLDEPASLAFFKKMAKDKLPTAPLLFRADGNSWVRGTADKPRIARKEWADGFRAAVRLANKNLKGSDRIPPNTRLYTMRHTVITDLLNSGIESVAVETVVGTRAQMIKQHYYKLVRDKLSEKLKRRQSF